MNNTEAMKNFGALGGPVHPTEWRLPDGGSIACPGITFRAYAAVHILAGINASQPSQTRQETVDEAIKQADALIATLNAPTQI